MKTLKVVSCILTIVASLAFCGCGTTEKFEYPTAMTKLARVTETPAGGSVAVAPCTDGRGQEYDYNTIMLYFIPLWIYGYQTDQRPELNTAFLSVNSYNFQVERDLTGAAFTSILTSNLFNKTFVADNAKIADADFIFRSTLLKMDFEGTVFSYGISFAAPVLWFAGLPAGTAENSLKIKFELFRKNVAEPVWSFTFENKDSLTIGIYYHYGDDAKLYPALMEQAMNAAVIDLYRHTQMHPDFLK